MAGMNVLFTMIIDLDRLIAIHLKYVPCYSLPGRDLSA